MAEVDVGGGGVDAEIDAERSASFEGVFEFRFQLGFGNDFRCAFFEVNKLFFDGFEFGFGHFLVRLNDPAAFDFEAAFEDDSNCFGINSVFLVQDSRGKCVLCVVVVHGQNGLENDGTGIEIFIDKMDCAAGEFDAIFEGLALRLKAGKRRQQRWVNVQDAAGERGHKIGRQKAHVAGEADEVDFVLVKDCYDQSIVRFALQTF